MTSRDIYISFLELQQLSLFSKWLESKDSAEKLDYEAKLDKIATKLESEQKIFKNSVANKY